MDWQPQCARSVGSHHFQAVGQPLLGPTLQQNSVVAGVPPFSGPSGAMPLVSDDLNTWSSLDTILLAQLHLCLISMSWSQVLQKFTISCKAPNSQSFCQILMSILFKFDLHSLLFRQLLSCQPLEY